MTITITDREVLTAVKLEDTFKGFFGSVKSKLVSDKKIISKFIAGLLEIQSKVNGIEIEFNEDSTSIIIDEELVIDLINTFGGVAGGMIGMIIQMRSQFSLLESRWIKSSAK